MHRETNARAQDIAPQAVPGRASAPGRAPARAPGSLLLALAVAVLSFGPPAAAQPPGREVPAFSDPHFPGALSPRWIAFRVAPWKARTEYRLVDAESGEKVLHARADRSASGLVTAVDVDPAEWPIVSWRWRVTGLVKDADNTRRATEDASARLMLEFDGDECGVTDLASATRFMRLMADPTTPHRVLRYVWSSANPVGSVLTGPLSDHVRMQVVASGSTDLDRWHAYTRDYRADFERAFGRPPGRLTAIGVMSDADNTGGTAEAYYGAITLGTGQGTLR